MFKFKSVLIGLALLASVINPFKANAAASAPVLDYLFYSGQSTSVYNGGNQLYDQQQYAWWYDATTTSGNYAYSDRWDDFYSGQEIGSQEYSDWFYVGGAYDERRIVDGTQAYYCQNCNGSSVLAPIYPHPEVTSFDNVHLSGTPSAQRDSRHTECTMRYKISGDATHYYDVRFYVSGWTDYITGSSIAWNNRYVNGVQANSNGIVQFTVLADGNWHSLSFSSPSNSSFNYSCVVSGYNLH